MAKKSGLGRGLGSLFEGSGLDLEPVKIDEGSSKTAPQKAFSPKGGKDAPQKAFSPKGSKAASAKTKDAKLSAAKEKSQPSSASNETEDLKDRILYIPISDIKPNSAQPRKTFDEDALKELAASIKENGVIQPIVVRPAKKGFELVAGERRWRAARIAELKTIPAVVREIDDRQNAFYALVENMQREDLNIIEEALGIEKIINEYDLTQDEAGKAVGKSRSYITNALRILKLPAEVQELVSSKKLSAGHARAIAGLPTEQMQIEAAMAAVKEGWSVRAIENYTGNKTAHKKGPRKKSYSKDIEIRNVEERLSSAIGTKVVINGNEKRGKIELLYFSRSELDRLVELLDAE